jgi:hypothetical protein
MRFALTPLRQRLLSKASLTATAALALALSSTVAYAQPIDKSLKITAADTVNLPNSESYCTGEIAATTQHAQYVSKRRYEIDCMMTELKQYQQAGLDPNIQYTAFKAQAWLSYAQAEDSEGSLSSAGTEAWQQGVSLLQGLREQQYELPNSTLTIPSYSTLLREDLWASLLTLKQNGAMAVAPRELAFSEVKLIWAAAEQCEADWRHAREHFDAAERWLNQATTAYVANDGTKLTTLQANASKLQAELTSKVIASAQCQGLDLTEIR